MYFHAPAVSQTKGWFFFLSSLHLPCATHCARCSADPSARVIALPHARIMYLLAVSPAEAGGDGVLKATRHVEEVLHLGPVRLHVPNLHLEEGSLSVGQRLHQLLQTLHLPWRPHIFRQNDIFLLPLVEISATIQKDTGPIPAQYSKGFEGRGVGFVLFSLIYMMHILLRKY